MPRFVDLIIPAPLQSTFTYRLTPEQESAVVIGQRAIVSFGPKHYYTGIVVNIHNQEPEGYEIKEVTELLDSGPIIIHPQYPLWQWMAQYYMCTLGDVMKAALPARLKLESETIVMANPHFEESASDRLSGKVISLLGILGNKSMSISSLEKFSGINNLLPIVRQLIDKEVVFIKEEIPPTYKPKTEQCIRILLDMKKPEVMEQAFNQIKKSEKQQSLFLKILDLSHRVHADGTSIIRQREALAASGCTTAILNELKKKGFVETYPVEVSRIEKDIPSVLEPLKPLSQVQQKALGEIQNCFMKHGVTLLHGVTASGKTEIYMHLIAQVIGQHKQVLYMLPEIALTTQLCSRLQRVFGKRMIVYHSKLNDNERVEIWHKLLTDTSIDIILGVRSSVLLPFRQLGLIIVDEEHEPSFKQQDPAPRYNGRDVAIVLASRHNAKVLLGSATPSLESYYLAQQGKYGYVSLTERHHQVQLPSIQLISTLEAKKDQAMSGVFTNELIKHLNHTLQQGKQAIIFQNRRGFSQNVTCTACAWTPKCPCCDVTLTYHKYRKLLTCHYCGYTMPIPYKCPHCGNSKFEYQGYGTERIEEGLVQQLPLAQCQRMDADTTSSKLSYKRIIEDFEKGKKNVLIGTQMVTKGLDFKNVQTVGILSADSLMNFPDFRAHERAFQLMEQVAGRAGRTEGRGEVLIQCSDVRHPLLKQVINHDYAGMAEAQLQDRERLKYPPFTRLINIYMKGRYEDKLRVLAQEYSRYLRQTFGERVLGPDAPAVSKIQNYFIQCIMLKIERNADAKEVRRLLDEIHENACQFKKDFARTVFYYDVDPY